MSDLFLLGLLYGLALGVLLNDAFKAAAHRWVARGRE